MSGKLFTVLSEPWLGTAIGVIGLLAGCYFYLKARRISRLGFDIDEITVVGGSAAAFPQGVEITFEGHKVPRVTATRMAFWNAGNTTISYEDVVASDPFRIEIDPDHRMLRAEVIKNVRDVNGSTVEITEKSRVSALIKFDFLDPGDGSLIEIIHSADKDALHPKGTIRGMKGAISRQRTTDFRDGLRLFPSRVVAEHRREMTVMVGGGIGIALLGVAIHLVDITWPGIVPMKDENEWGLVIGLGIFFSAFASFQLWRLTKGCPAALRSQESPETA